MMIEEPLQDRRAAGALLAEALEEYADRDDVLVLALPRGGVPVALEVARALGAPLDLMLVRKLGAPGQPELAMGAIATGGAKVLNRDIVDTLGISERHIDAVAAREQAELERRQRAYRGDRPLPEIRGKVVILVDDGIATGATMRAAVAALRGRQPSRIVVAAPVAAPQTAALLSREADEVICLGMPDPFIAVGRWYRAFPQVGDDEVSACLAKAASA